jgi:3-hydroxyisobutyrate dehydrogenase
MGANMARRLKDCGSDLAAVHDSQASVAVALGQELGAPAVAELAELTFRGRGLQA